MRPYLSLTCDPTPSNHQKASLATLLLSAAHPLGLDWGDWCLRGGLGWGEGWTPKKQHCSHTCGPNKNRESSRCANECRCKRINNQFQSGNLNQVSVPSTVFKCSNQLPSFPELWPTQLQTSHRSCVSP